MNRLAKLLLVIISALALAAISVGQTENSAITLTVNDQFGAAIADAEVVLTRRDARERRARTDRSGIVKFPRLLPGEYQILVSAVGFNDHRIVDLALRPGENRKLSIVLDVAPIESNVEIDEAEDADPNRPGVAAVLNEREIADLPDDQEEFERALRRIGQALTGDELPITVNGVQGGQIPPKQSIQQIRINQNVFSAQYGNVYGGGIEIFTRSNVDRFRGSAGFSFADSIFNTANPFLGRREPFQSRGYHFGLTGPLFGKKANFFLFANRSENDTSAVINAVVLDQGLNPVNFKQTLSTPTRSQAFSFRVNADPSKKHKLYLTYNIEFGQSQGQNVGGFSLPSRANETSFENHFAQFSHTYLISSSIVSQSRFYFSHIKNESFGGSNEAAINVLDAFFGGGSQQNSRNKSLRFDVSNDTTWQKDRYSLGLGFRVRRQRIDQNSLSNFGGTYTFAGRIAPVLDVNNDPVIGDDGEVLTTQISSLESYRRTLLFRQLGFSAQQIRNLGGGANQFTISGGEPSIDVTQYDIALYVQNSYKISETIAASFGLRYENQTNIGSDLNFAPRFGLIWAPKPKEKQNPLYSLPRISVGYGLFYARFALDNSLNIRLASDPGRSQYLITETAVLDLFPNVPTVDLLQQFALPRTQRSLADGFETPYQSLFNITATKRMPRGYILNFTYSRSRSYRQSFTQNINAPLAGTFDPLDPSSAVRPFGNVGNIFEIRSIGRLETDRFSVNLNFPQSQTLFANVRYSYGKSNTSVVSGSGSPFDPYDFRQDHGPAPYDGVHSGGAYFFYNLLKYKLSIGGDFSVNSGTRFNIVTGRDTNGDGFFSERPAFASDLTRPGLVPTKYGVLDPNPQPGDRLIPLNLGRGPTYMIFNTSINKRFGFNEDKANKKPPKQTLSFGIRVNNLFNIINKGNPIGNISSPTFLQSLSGFSDGSIVIINGARQVNFAGRSMTFNAGFSF